MKMQHDLFNRLMKVIFISLSLLFASNVIPSVVSAQNKRPVTQPAPGKSNERKTSLNFEDELVEGASQKPELFYLFQQKNFNYKRLIKLRENFRPEMRKTTEDIQRIRSEN